MKCNWALIKEKFNIVDYVSKYVSLRRAGRNYVGLCPFHGEKTPSFTVSEQKQIYHCFGCGASGDLVSFLTNYLKIENSEAVLMLEKDSGIKLIERSEEYNRKRAAVDKLLDINKKAAAFFVHQMFKSAEGAAALTYVSERKLSLETTRQFFLGYSGKEWDRLARYLESAGFRKEDIESSGLVSVGSSGTRDFFRDRLIFPIINQRNEVIGFGGRSLDSTMPKYLNSRENIVFSKRRNLFGINFAREQIATSGEVFIVEGYMDCITMQQEGYRNTVATLGTAITEEQVKYLKGFTKKFQLIYDADDAGKKAALRAAEVFANQGVSPYIVILPDGEDPASLLAASRKDVFARCVGSAQNGIDFIINYYKIKYSVLTADGLRNFLHSVKEHAQNIQNTLERELVVKEASKAANISPDWFYSAEPKSGTEQIRISETGSKVEDLTISFLIHNPGQEFLIDQELGGELPRDHAEILEKAIRGGNEAELSESAAKLYCRLSAQDDMGSPDEERKAFAESLVFLRKRINRKVSEDLNRKIQEASAQGDFDAVRQLQQLKTELHRKK